jgi:uncharacterized membrane protein
MKTTRLEAFSDGVLAIIITIMVLELKIPHSADLASLGPLWPVFISYVLSFVYLGIYWNNHHHMMLATESVTGKILWANLNLLFWLSLVPFGSAWMGENNFETVPTAMYGAILMMAAISYKLLQYMIVHHEKGDNKLVASALRHDLKGNLSIILYGAAIPLAFVNKWIAGSIYLGVAVMWFMPDRRIEEKIEKDLEEKEIKTENTAEAT